MNNTLQLYVDDEKTIKGYPVTSPDRVIDENGKSVKDKLKNNVKFDVVGQGVGAPPIDGGNAELVEKVENLEEQMGNKASKTFIDLKELGAKGDGVTDDSIILKNAIDNIDESGSIYLRNGIYLLNNVDITNKSITIIAESPNVEIISNSNYIIHFKSDWTNISNVLSVSNGTYNVDSYITMEDVSGYNIGDIVKIVSEDIIPGYDTSEYISAYGGGLRNGEYKVIKAIDSANKKITLQGALRGKYTNNIRVGIQGKHSFVMDNITISYKTSKIGVWVTGGINHKFNIITQNGANHTSLDIEGAYNYNCLAIIGNKNNSNYGIVDRNCSNSTISYYSKQCRHPYTTGHPRYSTQQLFECYGVSEYNSIKDSNVVGECQASYDCHEQSYNLIIYNSTSSNSSSLYSFQDRGLNTSYNNCNFNGYNIGQVTKGTRNTPCTTTFIGCTFTGNILAINDSEVNFINCKFVLSNSNNNIFISNSKIKMSNCDVYIDSNSTSPNIFNLDGICYLRFSNINVVFKNSPTTPKMLYWKNQDTIADILINNINVMSEVQTTTQFRLFRLPSSPIADGNKMIVNNFYFDESNGLNSFNSTNVFTKWSGGSSSTSYQNLVWKIQNI